MPTTFFGWIQFLLDKSGVLFLRGAGVTMLIAIVGTTVALMIGLLLVAILGTIPVTSQTSPRKENALGAASGCF